MAEVRREGGPGPAALAVAVPFAAYLATASGHGYWLDGGELVAQGVDFGIAHPPGHPLAGVISTAFAWLVPLGTIAFRVALASATLGALAAFFTFRAARRTFEVLGAGAAPAALLAVAAAWLAAGSHAWWLQGVRPEVYALQAALVMYALDRLVALEAAWPAADLRPLYAASFALGLALANHHFLAFLLLPAGAATLARCVRARGPRPLALASGFVFAGLAAYVYLPLRAARATLALGTPDTAARFWWVVSAEAFQKNQGAAVPQPAGERVMDVVVQLVEGLGMPVLGLALVGTWAMLRRPAGRRLGVLWLLVALVFVAARAWLGFVRRNPDALGYLMPAVAALAILAGAALASVAQLLGPRRRLAEALAVLALIGAGSQLPQHAETASLAGFRDTELLDDPLRREVPTDAVVLAHDPQTVFRWWGGEAQEHLRPDVTLVPVPFLGYPGMVERLAERDPDLRPMLRGALLAGELRQPDLQTLAGGRPVLVENDLRVPTALYDTLVPEGFYFRALADGATDADQAEGAERQARRWREVMRLLGDPKDPETRHRLLWHHYVDALYFAETGHRRFARNSVAMGRKIARQERLLIALEEALQQGDAEEGDAEDDEPLDTTPFRVGEGSDAETGDEPEPEG
ncbi:MAG TPA: DUF2723 domain-containing protein [Polyangiaceae bacterium LLY-WYZ-15_(1-7)]|nr:hypothetical protein [Myxococcales bacterium]MBJ71385.1 hypothetical protein [Sandaracinus sp.]HJK95169.1 DUF2723 domain-containing protein [Polyangiaceae bacterium LLY-WYZ-15_(1-7)]HJL06479.1 DUF2723 domain-containing protein [Polyangiaceae bacterium LLY-WYZ-15_(1-7)]HJL12349.1 DUF2723 domain-containing protein [Polyangiaceae bacterium LLY-WYZ-15_(1-7)]